MFQLLLFAVLSVTVYTNDMKQKLAIFPPPVPGFNMNAYLGQWFTQFRRAPCSWSGSNMFTDYETTVLPDRKGRLLNQLTWRSNGMCNQITGTYQIIEPGLFIGVDNIGDSISGRVIVAAIDYKKFFILWGCTKMSATGDRCDDPWISVSTRLRFPPPVVYNMIESILRSRWGITIGELQKVQHKRSCQRRFSKKC